MTVSFSTAILIVTGATYGWLALARRDEFDSFAEFAMVGAGWIGIQSFLLVVYSVAGWEGLLQALLIILEVMAESQ